MALVGQKISLGKVNSIDWCTWVEKKVLTVLEAGLDQIEVREREV